MQKQQKNLVKKTHSVAELDNLFNDYDIYVGKEQGQFLRNYLKSLELDLENAMTRGSHDELIIITEDIESLKANALHKLESLKID